MAHNSPTPKIGILNDTTYTTTFNYGESPNSTELDVHLPDPAVIVNEQEGEDKPGCGAKYDNKCNTIAYAGKNRMAEKAGIVLIEAGRFQETDSFDLDTKSGSFTSFGDLTPIISFALSDGAPAFVTKGTGTVRFEQSEGAVSLSTVEFSSLSFDGGCCVECVGTSSKLDISNCKFLQTKGVSLAQIVFEPSTPDSAVFSMKSTTLQGQEGTGVGGLKLTNVASVTVESVTMRRLESKTQKAAISIAKCSSLTLSSLLFELNSGTDASDLFVDSESLPVVSSTSSFSVSPSPTTSINGEQSDTVIPRQVLLVDASSAAQGPFCWATDGCKSISSLLPRLPAGVDWSLSMKEGIVGDLTLSMPEKQSIAVTGTSQAGSILQHTSLISSAFVEVSTGSLSLSQLTLATASTDPTLSSSFFIVSGGSLSLESVLVPSLSFSNSAAFAELTGSGSLSLKSVSFSDMSNEGSGSVVHSTSTGTISLDTVSFTRCNCNVTIEEEGTSGSHEVFLNGSSIPVTITSSNFGSTLGALADQTQTTMAQFVGEETSDSTMSGPLAYLLHRHETGTVYVDSSFWNHKFCGLATLPCQTLEATHEKLNENNQIVDFSSDLSMTGTVTSKATSSTIQSTATKTLTLTGSAQFVVSVGVLTLNALKLTVEDITTSRTSALVSVTTGSLAVSACSITIIDQTNTVPLVSVEGGSVIFSGATSVVNPPLTSSLLDVSGGSLSVTSPLSVTPINAARTTPLFDLEGGTTTLSSSVKSLFTSGTVFSVKPTAVLNLNTITDDLASTILGNLVTMTGGSVVLSGSFANGKLSESLVSGSGNLLIDDSSFTTFSPLSASNAESRLLTVTISTGETVQIGTSAKQVVFTSCSSSASGGVIHATVKGTGLLLIQNTKFDSCSTAQNGQAVYCVVESGNEKSALGNIRASLLPPTPSTIPAFSDSERTLAEYAVTSNGDETHVGSILYPFHPSTAQLSVHATAGHDHPLCGNTDLPCQSLKQAYSNIPAKTATHSLLIDTSVVLNEKLSTEDKTATISAEAGKKLEIDASGQFHLAIGKLIFANSELVLPSSCSRTVFDVCGASLEFLSTSLISHVGQSASKTTLQAPLFSLSSGSLIIQGEDGNPFKFSHFQTSPVISVDGTESPTLTLIHCHFVDCKSDGNAVIVLNGEKSGKVSFAHCYFNENSGLSSNDVWTSLAWNSALNQSSITSCFSDSNMDHLVVGTVLKNGFIPFSVLKVDPTSGDNLSCELPTIPCSTVLRSLELCVQTETDLSPALRLIEMTADVTESTSFVVGDKKIELNGTTADVQLRWDSSRHTMLSVSKGSADLHHFVLVHLHPSSTASFLTLLDVGALTLTSVVLDGSQDTFKTCLIQTEAGTLTLISVDISNVTLESSSLLVSKGAVFMEDCSFTSIISRHLSSPIKIGKTGIN
ncbi:hypothetical protein BLNAU_24032 [Blattamonas nauphoetae]|uniref:Uncharacterized protein n=1 Tax=Blattamonas nauphoetae TaxID=2049346 RepID=A0ABQ9WRF8_9EUKA|nr:hypothetical protein BLNAU_24032 [Blattamonas nauphoetae]